MSKNLLTFTDGIKVSIVFSCLQSILHLHECAKYRPSSFSLPVLFHAFYTTIIFQSYVCMCIVGVGIYVCVCDVHLSMYVKWMCVCMHLSI